MSKQRRRTVAVRVQGVSQRSMAPATPAEPPEGTPQPTPGSRHRVHGTSARVSVLYADRIGLEVDAGGLHRFSLGLLFRWLDYTWRVHSISSGGFVVLEAWGYTSLASHKLSHYQPNEA